MTKYCMLLLTQQVITENVASGNLPLSTHVVPKKKHILNTLSASQRCVHLWIAISTFPVSYLWCWL